MPLLSCLRYMVQKKGLSDLSPVGEEAFDYPRATYSSADSIGEFRIWAWSAV
jgi:hypothetical protein